MDCLSSLFESLSPSLTSSRIRLNRDDDYYYDVDGAPLDILCLGSGWTYSFLGPAALDRSLRIAGTTRDGRNGTIPFTFNPNAGDDDDKGNRAAFQRLPDAKLIVIIFPLYETKAVNRLVHGYLDSRRQTQTSMEEKPKKQAAFLQLGSTGVWDHGPTFQFAPLSSSSLVQSPRHTEPNKKEESNKSPWKDRKSEIDPSIPRGAAEEYLLKLNKSTSSPVSTSVLNLSGLWGHGRSPRRFIGRIAPDKETLKRLGSVHLVHGHDVARAIIEMARQWDKAEGQRWLLTNERVYDLWDLASRWGDGGEEGRNHPPTGPQRTWVNELVAESRSSSETADGSIIRAIPRTVEQMGSALDGTDFWITFGITPDVPWVD